MHVPGLSRLWHSGRMDSVHSVASPRDSGERDSAAAEFGVQGSGDVGVLLLHGITGSPAAWRPIAEALAADGTGVHVPLLPGHGTSWQELNRHGWSDWRRAAASALTEMRSRHAKVVVAGLSMGGALALELAAGGDTADGVDALVLVNPSLRIDGAAAALLPLLARFVPSIDAIGNDIARPGEEEHAYPRTPLRAVASLAAGQKGLRGRLWRVSVPTTLCVSGRDNVVGPWSSRLLRATLLRAPGEERLRVVPLRRSLHVATLDYDDHVILQEIRAQRDLLLDSHAARTRREPA